MVQIVWFKRDLRLKDHEPLIAALNNNDDIIPLYILEPDLWRMPDLSFRHYRLLCEGLTELNQACERAGQGLVIRVGAAINILNDLSQTYDVRALFSYEETWNDWTYQRDIKVRAWSHLKGIQFHEFKRNGVVRGGGSRKAWSQQWLQSAERAISQHTVYFNSIESLSSDILPTPQQLGLEHDGLLDRQSGCRKDGLGLLDSWLKGRGCDYVSTMSSPVTAYTTCSRLSTHLAFGTLSIREVFQQVTQFKQQLKCMPIQSRPIELRSVNAFLGRLRWHCHFIQKLEDEPSLEFKNLHPLYDRVRQSEFNQSYFDAWANGMTGYPMIDAAMRALIETGWINFRMRAMLVSFSSYHLWLDWKQPALHLARLFTDYEPGIHYSQIQMQSGTTGMNTLRIYNPVKQAIDQDPEGVFIRSWIPELRDMPDAYIHSPHLSPSKMNGYPMPIVDEVRARKHAAQTLYSLRRSVEHSQLSKPIVRRHGSRKKLRSVSKKKPHPDQGALF